MYNPYDDKYNLWSESILWGGLFKNNLEYIGSKEFYIIDKFQNIYRYTTNRGLYFYVKDIDETIKIPIRVKEEEYSLYEIGKPYRELGIVRLKKQNIEIVTNATNKDSAIKEVLKKSWTEFSISVLILLAFLATILYPIF